MSKNKPTCLPFGQWNNVPFADVPTAYLRWVLQEGNLWKNYEEAVKEELSRRENEANSKESDATELVEELLKIEKPKSTRLTKEELIEKLDGLTTILNEIRASL